MSAVRRVEGLRESDGLLLGGATAAAGDTRWVGTVQATQKAAGQMHMRRSLARVEDGWEESGVAEVLGIFI